MRNLPPRAAIRALSSAISQRLSSLTQWEFPMLSAVLARLSVRERRFVAIAGLVSGGALLYLLVVDPLWQMQADMRARVAAKERELQDILAMRNDYLAAKAEVAHLQAASGANFSPVAFLEEVANGIVGQDKVAAITPAGQESRAGATLETIELKLSGVSLRELVDLLYKIETTGAMLHPTKLSVKKRYKDPYTFDVLLTTVAINAR